MKLVINLSVLVVAGIVAYYFYKKHIEEAKEQYSKV